MYRWILLFLLLWRCGASEANKPNLLLITIDTLRADRLGAYGRSTARTPNLDALAAKSLLFEQAICSAPLTLPSHTSLMTGRSPHHHGIRDNAGRVPDKENTLAEILKKEGYHTYAAVGGFPLDHRFGLNQGFDVYSDEFPRQKNRPLDFGTERPADAVLAAVRQMKIAEPYFLWVHFYDPHAPYLNGGYEGEITFVDTQIGLLLKTLPTQNTIIAVAGDHGESLGEHGEWTHRIFIYDSTMHVPFWISAPGMTPRRVREQARLIDFFPTVLSLIGVSAPSGIDGAVLPQKAGQPAQIESLFAKLQLGWSPLIGIRTHEWKYIEAPRPELYDLRTDPGEKQNVIAKRPEVARKIRALLPSQKEQTSAAVMDPETAEQLASLGYISGGSAGGGSGADPKDRIAIWNEIEKAVDLDKTNSGQTIAVLEKARKADPQNPMVLNFLAEKYVDAGKLPAAEEILNTILRQDPGNTLALSRMAHLQLRKGNPQEALKAADKLQAAGVVSPEIHLLRAQACLQLDNTPCAETNLKETIRLDPADMDTRNDLANFYLQTGRNPAALAEFQEVLKRDPGNTQAINGLATEAFAAGRYEESESYLKKATQLAPADPQTKINLALVYATTGRVDQATVLYKEILASGSAGREWKEEAAARLKALSN